MDLIKVGEFEKVAGELVVSMTDGLDEIITGLEDEFDIANIPADLSDSESYKLVQKALREIKKPRIQLEKDRKAIKAIPLAIGKKIDAAPKPYFARVEKLELAWKKAKDDYDDEQVRIAAEKAAELQRVQDEILAKIEEIQQAPFELWNLTSDGVLEKLTELENDNLEWAGCMIDRATNIKVDAVARIKTMYDNKVTQEKTEAEAEEREAKEQAEREAREAEEAKREEERAEREKAERERLEEENKKLKDALSQKQPEGTSVAGGAGGRTSGLVWVKKDDKQDGKSIDPETKERAKRISKEKAELVRILCYYFGFHEKKDTENCIRFVDDIYVGKIKGLRVDQ